MTAAETAAGRIRVLHSLAPPDGTTKYVDQMTVGAPDDIDILYFSWRQALRGGYDVLHLHWPEFLVRARSTRLRFAKRQAMRAVLLLARARRVPIVRTLHNVHPHSEGVPAERRLLYAVDRRTSAFIRLNPTTPAQPSGTMATILHGHYRDRFAAHPRAAREPGLVLFFGIIRPRKGVEQLIDVFASRSRPGQRLRIVGSPTAELGERIIQRISVLDNVSARLAFVDDDQLVGEITAATLVALPYAEMHNSGAALVALSLDRPILVPRTPANTALAQEVGGKWVLEYDGPLTDDILTDAIERASRIDPADRPRLEERDWDEIGRRHREVYRAALAAARTGKERA